jgi:N-acyl homoserine lactone hydrolase
MRQTGDMAQISVHRVDYGYFVRPAEETGTGAPRVEPCLGYLVRHPDGVLLFDTGMGRNDGVDDHYRPRRFAFAQALASVGATPDEVTHVVNCHLHFDHCGGNPALRGRPVFVQRVELAEAVGTPDYTMPELLDGGSYEELDGEAEVLPHLYIVPTPGHTNGHQSLVIRAPDGTVIVAGQSHDTATAYAGDVLAWRAARDGHPQPLPAATAWIDRLQRFDPSRVVFAHDHAVWMP